MNANKLRSILTGIGIILFVHSGTCQSNEKMIDSISVMLKNYVPKCKSPCLADSFKVNMLCDLGFYYNFSRMDTAIEIEKEGLKQAHQIGYVRGQVSALIKLGNFRKKIGNVEESRRNFDQAIELCDSILALGKDSVVLSNKAVAISEIASIEMTNSNYFEALRRYNTARSIHTALGNKKSLAISLTQIAMIYNAMQQYDRALDYLFKSLQMKKENADKRIGGTLGTIGAVYWNIRDTARALDYYITALDTFLNQKDKQNIAISLNNIGEIYREKKQYEKALEYFSRALDSTKSFNYKRQIPDILINTAELKNNMGQNKEAIQIVKEALVTSREYEMPHQINACYINLGGYLLQEKKYDEAKSYLDSAIALSEKNGFQDFLMSSNELLTDYYTSIGDFEKALACYKNATVLKDSIFNDAKISGIKDLTGKFEFDKKTDSMKVEQQKAMTMLAVESERRLALSELARLSAISAKQKELSEAERQRLEAENERKEALLTIKTKEAERANAERQKSELQLLSDRRQTQLSGLAGIAGIIFVFGIISFLFYKRKRDAEQKQKETLLSLQVSETEMKALRSQMNPHFIFNSLQSIQTFLISHKSEDANLYLLKFSKLMRAVLENSQFNEVPLKEDMQALELYMQLESIRLTHPFTYQFHIDPMVDIETDSLPPLILQPFVENAIWHGLQHKQSPGHIDIHIYKSGNVLHAIVEDNGVGRDRSRQVAQPMLLKKESLGMKLTEDRLKVLNEVRKFNAKFSITDLFTEENQPAGTKVELSLPLVA